MHLLPFSPYWLAATTRSLATISRHSRPISLGAAIDRRQATEPGRGRLAVSSLPYILAGDHTIAAVECRKDFLLDALVAVNKASDQGAEVLLGPLVCLQP